MLDSFNDFRRLNGAVEMGSLPLHGNISSIELRWMPADLKVFFSLFRIQLNDPMDASVLTMQAHLASLCTEAAHKNTLALPISETPLALVQFRFTQ